ncbi:MAG: repeat containing protein [Cyanobacteria bacterium RYN_339]|nr:repeat containing protein [Cyanobacteria bacterium RYN_339]
MSVRPPFSYPLARALLAVALSGVAACQGTTPTKTTGTKPTAGPKGPITLTPPPELAGPGHVSVTAVTPAPPAATPTPAGPPVSVSPLPTTAPATSFLAGLVTAPSLVIANNGAGLVSDAGGGILSNNGGGIIANNGGGILSNNGSGVVANNGAGYRLFAAANVGGLSNAFLYLTNRDEKFFLDATTHQAFVAASDKTGAYSFPITADNGFPTGKDVVVNAMLNEDQRLTGFLTPINGKNTLDVTLGTTLVTEFLRADAARRGKALKDYEAAKVAAAVKQTEDALASGDLPVLRTVAGPDGKPVSGAAFDLRLQHVDRLRNQYVIAFAAVDAGKTALHQLSDAWKALFGMRPTAVTTVAGNGAVPTVTSSQAQATGDGDAPDLVSVPMGYCAGIAIAKRGDVFVSGDANDSADGHVRWLHPGGKVGTLWFPQFRFEQPNGVAVESEPAAGAGAVLLAGSNANYVVRVPMVDAVQVVGNGPARPQTIVAGEFAPLSADETDHPVNRDGGNTAVDTSQPQLSYFRLADEGARIYLSGDPVPDAARYAHINHPEAVAVDEAGNIYIADTWNQRIRMIPKADGSYFGYKQPLDVDGDGVVEGFGPATPMKAGAMYTIAGNPIWDVVRTADEGGHWFGDFAGDGGPAQAARLDAPVALAFFEGALYVVDQDNQRIRRIQRATGTIDTIAGKPVGAQKNNGSHYFFPGGSGGDNGPAALAQLDTPRGLAIDAKGKLYFYEAGSQRVRMVDLKGAGMPIVTVAGHLPNAAMAFGAAGGDGEALAGVTLTDVRGLAVDPAGNLLLTDFAARRIRKVWRQWE